MAEKSKRKPVEERRQPKFDKLKNPPEKSGDGLDEFVNDEPNLKPGDQQKKEQENKEKRS